MLHTHTIYRRNWQSIKYTVIISIISTLLFSAVSNSAPANTQDDINALIESTNQKHQLFSAHFQALLLTRPQWPSEKYKQINPLLAAVKKYTDKNDNIHAVHIILANIDTLNKNYDNQHIFYLIQVLLDQNNTKTANALFELINDEGDQALISNIAYIFAQFSFKQKKWEKTLRLLDGAMSDLPGENHHHALLMQGISLQKLGKHREALPHYEKIKPASTYYLSARLNMAIANIKRGWWTDGHILIQDAVKSAEALKQEEALNRLYLTLGYSLLKQQYYRDARNFFRHIGIDSSFANRALLGITLTAANQNDYVGALSTARILKNKQTYDLPVDESYLLMPYFYEQLQQSATASAGYLEAINYYQKRIADIQSVINTEINLKNHPITIDINTTLEISNNPVNFSYAYPDYFLENYLKLQSYKKHIALIGNKNIKMEYEQLINEYKSIIVKMIHRILKKRIEQLDSYMGQSRFGLARLYDNNLIDN